MTRVKVSYLALLLLVSASLSAGPTHSARAQEIPYLVSKWGLGMIDALQLLVKLSNEPERAAEYGMGAALGAAGFLAGKKIGKELGKAVGGDGLGAAGALGGASAGAIGGAKLGAALGGGMDRALKFIAQEKELLAQARLQQSILWNAVHGNDQADESLERKLKDISDKLSELSNLVDGMEKAVYYNPFVARTINDHKISIRDKTLDYVVKLDRISHAIGL